MTGLWLERVSTAGMRYSRIWEDWSKGQLGGLNQLGQLTYEFYFVMTDAMKEELESRIPTIVVMGKTGTGKSTLCNALLLGPELELESKQQFSTSPSINSCTYESKRITGKIWTYTRQ